MRKVVSVLVSLAIMGTLLIGCGNPTSASTSESASETAAGSTTEEATPLEGSTEDLIGIDENTLGQGALNIAIVSSPSGVDDGSFNQNNYEGIQNFIADNPESTVTPVREETGDVQACIQKVQDIVADYDVIVCCGYQFAAIGDIATENPDVYFILVDSYPTDSEGNTVECENVYAMQFKEQESGFCAGIAAALETTTGKVAVVNGIAYPSNVNYQFGFESGVNYAVKYLGATAEIVELPSYAGTDVTGADVGGNYVGSFSDEATGKIVGKALIDEGVDIIFVAAGASGNGVFTAAKEATDVMVIGCDVDQYDDGANGDSNIILTSGLKVMDANVMRVLVEISSGNFEGGNFLLGADTDSTGFVSTEGRCQLSDETIAAIYTAFDQVKSGDIVPASSDSGTTPEDFQGL